MRIHLSGLLQDMSGSLGNLVASKWKGLHYFREKASVVSNPKTEAQMFMRNKMVGLIAGWWTLTAAQIALWFEYAQAQGSANEDESQEGSRWLIPKRSRTQSGINAYVGVNQRLNSCALANITNPPLTPSIEGPTNGVMTWLTPTMTVDFDVDAALIALKPGLKYRLWLKGLWKGSHAYIHESGAIAASPVAVPFTTIRMGSVGLIFPVPLTDLVGKRILAQVDIVAPDGSISPGSSVMINVIT